MQILGSNPKPTESEVVVLMLSNVWCQTPPDSTNAHQRVWTTGIWWDLWNELGTWILPRMSSYTGNRSKVTWVFMYVNYISRKIVKHAVCHQMFPNIQVFLTGFRPLNDGMDFSSIINHTNEEFYFLLTFHYSSHPSPCTPHSTLWIHLARGHSFLKNYVISPM